MTELTLSSLGITNTDYNNSLNELLKEPTTAKLIANMELEVREKYEPVLPLKSRDEVKKIYCQQLQIEDIKKKLHKNIEIENLSEI